MKDRLNFIVILRAIAVLIVLYSHLFQMVNFRDPNIFKSFGLLPFNVLAFSSLMKSILSFPPDIGQVGVGIFFFVSGFVIPISLEKYGSIRFIAQRILRLYPVYLICMLLWVSISFLYAKYTGQPKLPYIPIDLLTALFLGNTPSYNQYGVTWTLAIESRFYLISVLVVSILTYWKVFYLKNKDAKHEVTFWFLIACITITSCFTRHSGVTYLYILFIGTAFFLHFTKRIGTIKLVIATLSIFLMFTIVAKVQNLFPLSYVGIYLAGIAICCLFYCRQNIVPNRFISFVANISYPLYLCHPLSYPLISYCVHFLHMNIILIYIMAIIFIVTISFILHKLIEKPFIGLGKRITILH